jgi:DNA-binding CsgD family transcriptional regulator
VEAIQGNYAAAVTLYKENLALCREMGDENITPALEGLADVALRQGRQAWAARLWGAAETLREEIRMPLPPVERAYFERAVDAARDHLGEQAFTALWVEGRTMSLEHVLDDQEPVSSPRPALTASPSATMLPPASGTRLTAREMDVLCLLTQGLTSAQIAEQLVIGVVTVNFHVRSIYSKLGVSSRSAATRYAIEHHLV